jgi:hypothetical protein
MNTDTEPNPSYDCLSTSSLSDSMVEIKRTDVIESPANLLSTHSEEKHRLVYSKSKVYVNPTAYARDNIPGFVALVKRETANPTFLLAWIPETLLNEKGSTEWDKFARVEERPAADEEDDGKPCAVHIFELRI